MTTIDPPASLVRLPSLAELRRMIMGDRAVLITLIVVSGVVLVSMIAMFTIIVGMGGDSKVVAAAFGGVITAVSMGVARVIKARREGPAE